MTTHLAFIIFIITAILCVVVTVSLSYKWLLRWVDGPDNVTTKYGLCKRNKDDGKTIASTLLLKVTPITIHHDLNGKYMDYGDGGRTIYLVVGPLLYDFCRARYDMIRKLDNTPFDVRYVIMDLLVSMINIRRRYLQPIYKYNTLRKLSGDGEDVSNPKYRFLYKGGDENLCQSLTTRKKWRLMTKNRMIQ